ncbi:MAG TPA: hypothetical protein VMW68_02155, partial [Methyloceanibacter sp.]|nr:hypothetical protein [Methyloceanibacter sp.]
MTIVSSWADADDREKPYKKIAETTAIAVLNKRMTMPSGSKPACPAGRRGQEPHRYGLPKQLPNGGRV